MAKIIGTEQKRMLSNARLDADRLQQEAERMAVSEVRRLVRDGELLPIEDFRMTWRRRSRRSRS